MNTEQAIKKLKELEDGRRLNIESWAVKLYTAAIKFAIAALYEKQERESSKPLTLEQLKKRVGKPVYRRWRNGNGTWEVLERIEEKTEIGNSEILIFFQHNDWFPERFDLAEFFDHEPKEV
jgi:hypothetical protein